MNRPSGDHPGQQSFLWLEENTFLYSFQAAPGEVGPALCPSAGRQMCCLCLPAAGWLESCFSDRQTQAPYLHLEEKPSKPWYKRSSFHFFGKRAANELIITAAQKGGGREEENVAAASLHDPAPGQVSWRGGGLEPGSGRPPKPDGWDRSTQGQCWRWWAL